MWLRYLNSYLYILISQFFYLMLILQILLAACCLASVTLCLVQRLQFSARLNKTDAFIAQLNAQQAQFDILRNSK